jgi:hypothetical protein
LKDTIASKLGSTPVSINAGSVDILGADSARTLAEIGVTIPAVFVVLYNDQGE